MPIWFGDKKFQDDVLEGFKRYFEENTYFFDFFTNAYLTGLEEDGLRNPMSNKSFMSYKTQTVLHKSIYSHIVANDVLKARNLLVRAV